MPRGRRSAITPLVLDAIIAGMQRGLSRSTAAAEAGASKDSLRRHLATHVVDEERVATAEDKGEASLLGHIIATASLRAPGSWQAAAWLLERRYPERYGQKARLEISHDIREQAAAIAAETGRGVDEVMAEIEAYLREQAGVREAKR